ncbi:related to Nuclear receptor co-repressor/HDAC3 complex subunit TBLR1 [Melanopsichium pennsylvanicum]|uniref:Related to Nuclear receptor co-repressor/HDAC3 complex subunit TBLR1 n=2 Tax=Melanopsichium pennsylvanicum TaxID=63383 RepID=A0AAJ4XG79_9BASI|nr:related to Nuclear receptor co-repressor/HDAC3 complex subunit TBLR1 [Melanopsichium pennsylvanicum 4]SNX81924.1 related to Nuclear receptor co-repressor/HDAC3 complex subunit TBLR1 [Melanopsichium pennsylvanicum]
MAPLCTSAEVNLLVYHYLKESGFHHASFSLRHESRLDDSSLSKEAIVEPGQLVRFLQKGLIYASVEAHIQEDGTEKPCSSTIRLVGPPHVCDGKSRPTPPPAEPTRLSPEPNPFAAQQSRPEHKEAATQTPARPASVDKTVNGVHSSKAPVQLSSLRNETHDRTSKVASSSKKKLEDAMEEEDNSSVSKSKDAKRKASASVTCVDADREDKRVRRAEAEDKADGASTSEARREADEHTTSRKDRRNGEVQSRSASPSVEKKTPNEQRSKDKDNSSSKKKKGGKLTAGENGEGNKKRGDKGKDPKAPIPQPKGNNFVKDGQITTLAGHTGEVFISAWNPTVPNMLASGGGDATVRIWEVPDKAGETPDAPTICKHLPATQSKDISTLDWNPDGTLLASGSYDGIVRLWTPQGDLHLVMSMHQGAVISVRWNRKGNMLLTGSADGTIIVWDLNSGKPRHTFSLHTDSVLDVEWLSTADGSLKPKSTSDAPPPMPHGLSPSVADTYFATCSADNSINLCKLGEPKPVKSFKGHTDEVNAIRFDPSQTLLASVSDDTTAKIWALDIGAGGAGGSAASAANSAGDTLRKRASQRRGGSAHLDGMDVDEETMQRSAEDSNTDREREKDRPTPGSVGGSAAPTLASTVKERASPAPGNNCQLGTASNSSNTLLSTTGKGAHKGLRLTLTGHSKELYALAWCSTGPGSVNPDQPRMLATSSFDWTARLWNADNGDCLRVIDAHEDNVYTLRFSPDARYLATGGIDKKVIISRVDNGALVQQYLGGGAIFDIAWKDMRDTVETKPEDGDRLEAEQSGLLAKRHQLAIAQADRKLTILYLADLDAVESTTAFKVPPPVEPKAEADANSDKPPKKQARGGV